ncbi:MAG: hypothetical protein RL701_1970 [Pseudomonadota bacterium]|jgi:HEAT repeat protein
MRTASKAPPRNVAALLGILQATDGNDSRTLDAKRAAAAKDLGDLGDLQAEAALIQALSHPNQVSVAAALALGRMRLASAVAPLVAVLEDQHKFWMPRGAAAVALGHMGPLAATALPALTKALEYDLINAGTSWDVLARDAVEDAVRHLSDPAAACTLELHGKRYAIWGFS